MSWFCHKLCDRKWLQFLSSPFFYLTNNRILDDLMPTWAIYVEIYHHSFFFFSLPLLNWIMLFWHYRSIRSHILSLLPDVEWFGHISIFRDGKIENHANTGCWKGAISPSIFNWAFNGGKNRRKGKDRNVCKKPWFDPNLVYSNIYHHYSYTSGRLSLLYFLHPIPLPVYFDKWTNTTQRCRALSNM